MKIGKMIEWVRNRKLLNGCLCNPNLDIYALSLILSTLYL